MIVHILHDESQRYAAYRGVVCTSDRGHDKKFFTGDVLADLQAAQNWAYGQVSHVLWSSSIDHFFMDVPGYHWAVDPTGVTTPVADNPSTHRSRVKRLLSVQKKRR